MRAALATALALAAAAVLAIGCGGDDEKIPRDDAAELRVLLLEAKRRMDPLRCDDLANRSLPDLRARARRLPEGSDVRETVEDGLDHLRSLIAAECTARDQEQEETTPTTDPETTQPEPEQPEPEPEQPEPEPEPQQPEPEPQQPEPEPEPEQPPGNNGDGNGNGGRQAPSGAVKPKKDRG